MVKTRLFRWASFALGTAATTFAFEGCVVQSLLDGVLGVIAGV